MNWSNTLGVLRSLIGSWFGMLLLVCTSVLAVGAKGQTDLVAEQIELLKSPDAAIRVNAAAALGKFKDPRAVEPLIGALRDITGEVRWAAAMALGELKDARAVEPLIPLLKEKGFEAEMSVSTALGRLRDPRAIDPLIAALINPDLGDGRFAGMALGQIGAPAVEPLLALLRDKNAQVRITAAQTLGGLGGNRAIDPLMALLRDPEADVRAAAAVPLAMSGLTYDTASIPATDGAGYACARIVAMQKSAREDSRVVDALIAAAKDPDKNVRETVAIALQITRDVRSASTLIADLKDAQPDVRRMAARSLSDIDDPRVLDPLIAALSDPDSTTRQYASESLSMKHESAVASLIAALTNKDAGIRSAAAETLAHAKDPRVVEGLMQTLKDPQAGVRVSAANALRQLKDARALEPLLAAIDDPDPNVRRSVVFAIGAIGDPRAITPLVNSLNRARNADKGYYIAALGDLGSGAVEPLVVALKMSDPGLKNAVVEALGKTKSPLAIAALVGPLNDPYDGMMHIAAANALAEIPDPGAVTPLIESLKGPSFGGARESLPGALVKLGSLAVEPLIALLHDPDSHTRLIAAATLANIKDPRATSALLKALQERNGAVIAGAYMFYVDRGEAGSEDALIEALKQFGGEQMAGYLLNCGDATVEAAARNWEKSHGMEMQQRTYGVLWGHEPTVPSPCEMQ